MLKQFALILAAAYSSLPAYAESLRPVYTPPPASPVSAGGMFQVILSLILVLGMIVLVAWILKRINLPQNSPNSALKVISGVAVGQRERIVLVEVNDTWLVVGVAPGQVTGLHTMPKNSLSPIPSETAPDTDNKFKNWLKVVMEKRNAG